MGHPKVSLIMGTYNRPDYLREAIESVVAQTMVDWELILMNDGGVDVADIIDEIGDKRIRYFHDPVNRGFAFRLNQGLDKATGDYIAYLGDDDLYYPNHFEVLSKTLDENPDIGAAYSNLYAVQFVKDEATGRRYPLNKIIQVARDFNRDFMFHFNHTLHVSLMHRRDLAIKAGGYDENVTVLIDWNITRKLCFYTDFKYVPVVTGEYYMPVGKSDRISNLEREDPERFKHNLRKIKANLPPEPWPKVHRIGIVIPVDRWTDETVAYITEFIDHIDHPARYAIVNNSGATSAGKCLETMGKIGDLKNVKLVDPPNVLSRLDAYRLGASSLDVDYVYLPTEKAERKFLARLIRARSHLEGLGNSGIKWDFKNEIASRFDFLMGKNLFLKITAPKAKKSETNVTMLRGAIPRAFKWDHLYHSAQHHHKESNLDLAYALLNECEKETHGAGTDVFVMNLYAKVCLDMKLYKEAEEKCFALIGKGYGADNYIRLGKVLQAERRFAEAVEAYRKGLEDIGLDLDEFADVAVFMDLPEDFGCFEATIGLAECLLESGDMLEAARTFRRASKLKGNSHRPLLGFAKLFLRMGDTANARQGIDDLLVRDNIPAGVYCVLGEIEEKEANPSGAFLAYRKAMELDPADPEISENFFRLQSLMGNTGHMERFRKASGRG